jgi:RNA polymerase sigma factor (sigma-70 family)
MSLQLLGKTANDVHLLLHLGSLGSWTDGQLVTKFLTDRDAKEAAFRALVVRHGPMVLGVCQRVLDNPHAAEDAFQATFLVLVRKARMLKDRDRLTGWLYGVALRIARKTKVTETRRRVVERHAGQEISKRNGSKPDQLALRAVIEEEINRLPERYRLPLVLCHVEGMQHQEVAQRLGCPVGTVESRLSRAREKLRTRLVRRGLAPTAEGILAAVTPAGSTEALARLIEEATRAATASQVSLIAGAGKTGVWHFGLASSLGSLAVAPSGLAFLSLAVFTGAIAYGMGAFRGGELPTPPHNQLVVQGQPGAAVSPGPSPVEARTDPAPSKSAEVEALTEPAPSKSADSRRACYALARPMSRIVIDGRLDDWPTDLKKYPIRNRLTNHPLYDQEPERDNRDPDAYFMAGYNMADGLIYLAVIVKDDDLVVGHENPQDTDAVEIYIDGLCSDHVMSEPPSGDWLKVLQASAMPVVQYIGLPGQGPIYGTSGKGNPVLMYGDLGETSTKMRYRRTGGITVYEWAVQAFDRYPDRPTRIKPGKRVGLEVAVVDKDSNRRPPSFTTWGPSPRGFKGLDARQLGVLILDDGP